MANIFLTTGLSAETTTPGTHPMKIIMSTYCLLKEIWQIISYSSAQTFGVSRIFLVRVPKSYCSCRKHRKSKQQFENSISDVRVDVHFSVCDDPYRSLLSVDFKDLRWCDRNLTITSPRFPFVDLLLIFFFIVLWMILILNSAKYHMDGERNISILGALIQSTQSNAICRMESFMWLTIKVPTLEILCSPNLFATTGFCFAHSDH